ncbi:MAG: nucleotidyltransferase domain-containing protein [Candidatus Woesearchaeota archaeon]
MLLDNRVQVLEAFVGKYTREITGSDIARMKNLNQKTVSSRLQALEDQAILKSRTEGRNRLFSLNTDNKEIVKHVLIGIEHVRTARFFSRHPLLGNLSEKMQQHIKGSAAIFGSYVKGTQKRSSDLDVLIIGDCDEDAIEELGELHGIDINLKIYPEYESDILVREALEHHIFIKNAENLIEVVLDEQDTVVSGH